MAGKQIANRIDQLTEEIIPVVDAALAAPDPPKNIWVAQHVDSTQPVDDVFTFHSERDAVEFVAKKMSIDARIWVSIWETNPQAFHDRMEQAAHDDRSDYWVLHKTLPIK